MVHVWYIVVYGDSGCESITAILSESDEDGDGVTVCDSNEDVILYKSDIGVDDVNEDDER